MGAPLKTPLKEMKLSMYLSFQAWSTSGANLGVGKAATAMGEMHDGTNKENEIDKVAVYDATIHTDVTIGPNDQDVYFHGKLKKIEVVTIKPDDPSTYLATVGFEDGTTQSFPFPVIAFGHLSLTPEEDKKRVAQLQQIGVRKKYDEKTNSMVTVGEQQGKRQVEGV